MVTAQESQEKDDSIEIIEPPVTDDGTGDTAPEVETPTTESTDQAEPASMETEVAPAPSDAVQEPSPQPQAPQEPQQPQMTQSEINELQKRRTEETERTWQDKVGRTAQALEKRLVDQGHMPEHARDRAREFVRNEQKFKKHEQETAQMLGYVQGKQNATIKIMKDNGLITDQMIKDFMNLQGSNSPDEMVREAKRMKRERELVSENTRLKQGRVSPQSFDNSQGAAEVTSNQDRLLDAYINGDRSEAAVTAAKRLAMGN